MIKFILGMSITLNIVFIIILFIIYHIGFKTLKNKLGELYLSSKKIDTDFLDDLKASDIKL